MSTKTLVAQAFVRFISVLPQAIDPDYYGFRDEEDGVLEKVEGDAERLMRMQVRVFSYIEQACLCSASFTSEFRNDAEGHFIYLF